MTDEIKEVETVETPETPVEEIKTDVNEVVDETTDKTKNVDNGIDYKEELRREREAREKAEKALAEKRFKQSKAKREEDVVEADDIEEDIPLTAKELESILARERQQTQKQLQEEKAAEIIKSLASSEDEAELIADVYKNRNFPAHLNLRDQIEEAYAIANRRKLLAERDEAVRALKNKGTVNNNPATTHHDEPQGNEPQLSASDKIAIQQAGLSYNNQTRRYEKKLANGKTLIRDSKTGRISIS